VGRSFLPTLLPNTLLQWWARPTLRFMLFLFLVYSLNAAAVSRIATVAPSLTELVFAAGAGDKLVAVSAYSDYPAEAKKLPQVADYSGINLEALLARKPDLVLVWTSGTREADIQRLAKLGIRVEAIGVNALTDVPKALRRIGQLAGTTAVAEIAAQQFETRLVKLQRDNQAQIKVSAFFEISRTPLMTIGGTHFISEVLNICGATNVFANVDTVVFEPSREALLAKNPRMILYAAASKPIKKERTERDNAVYRGLSVVDREHVYAVEADHILRPGPRLIDAAEQVCGLVATVRREITAHR
jgi:iron complex transport system substrate-binding protein